jgi:hypothetical protein
MRVGLMIALLSCAASSAVNASNLAPPAESENNKDSRLVAELPAPTSDQASAPAADQPILAKKPMKVVNQIPAGYEIVVTPLSDFSSKGVTVGHTFTIATVFDVMLNGYVAIPRGTLGQARVAEGPPVSCPGIMLVSGFHLPGLTPADVANSSGVNQPKDV